MLLCELFVDVEPLESVSGLRHIATNQVDSYFRQETPVVEERLVRGGGAKRDAVTLECKLLFFCFINVFKKVLLNTLS